MHSTPREQRLPQCLRWVAAAALIALIGLCLAWETVLAPLRPGGSWLMLKGLPLLAPLFGILHGRRYTYQWASLLILLYFGEGAVRAWSDSAPSSAYALAECLLAAVFFGASVSYARITGRAASAPPASTEPARSSPAPDSTR